MGRGLIKDKSKAKFIFVLPSWKTKISGNRQWSHGREVPNRQSVWHQLGHGGQTREDSSRQVGGEPGGNRVVPVHLRDM